MANFQDARRAMVDVQLAGRGIADHRVLDSMRTVPREEFVARGFRDSAYRDEALPIDEGQTISQPYVVALMLEAAALPANADRVLEIGTGSGYAAAVLSRLASIVYSVERHPALAAAAAERCARLRYDNVHVKVADGTEGWPEMCPFTAIIVSAAAPATPPELLRQLAIGGRLIAPIGEFFGIQRLTRVTRDSQRDFTADDLGAVSFVPLIGRHAWSERGQRADDAAKAAEPPTEFRIRHC